MATETIGVEAFRPHATTGLPDYEFHRVIDAIEHQLRRHEVEVDSSGRVTWKQMHSADGKPLPPRINDQGISDCITILRSYINSVTALSAIPKEEKPQLYRLIHGVGEDIIRILWFNYENYEISDPSQLDIIYNILFNPIFYMTFHPLDKSALNALGTMLQTRIIQESVPGLGSRMGGD